MILKSVDCVVTKKISWRLLPPHHHKNTTAPTSWMADAKNRILIIGITGNIGFELALACINASYVTFGLVRESALDDPKKARKVQFLDDCGVHLSKGSLEDEDSLIEALKQVEVVICAVSSKQVLEQRLLISAIKRVGCIKRFFPSEFGADPDKTQISNLDNGFYSRKAEIRRLVEAEGIPYTYICCNFYTSYLLPSLVQPGLQKPPRDKVTIFGDGNVKAVFMKECDVASFTISTVDDPRTLNKTLYLRPQQNTLSMNELIDIWERKIGTPLERNYISGEKLLEKIHETPYPENMPMVFIYSGFVKGDQTYFEIDSSKGMEGTQLYPDVVYTSVSKFLDTLL